MTESPTVYIVVVPVTQPELAHNDITQHCWPPLLVILERHWFIAWL